MVRGYLRSLRPGLSRDVWVLQGGSFANAFGNGIVMPFLLIYLHNVRGIPLATAGLVLAANGLAAVVAGLCVGPFVDRTGARAVLAGAMAVSAAGFGAFIFVDDASQAFPAAAVAGFGNGAFWPAQSSLIAALTERGPRSAAYAMQRVTHNLGIGIGGVVGGFVATTERPETYTLLFLADAATFLAYIAMLGFVASPSRLLHQSSGRGGYRTVLYHKAFVAFLVLNGVFIAVGFALLQDILPAYAKNEAGVSEKGIGLVFLANTMVVVVAQMPVARVLEGKRRMMAYAHEAALWAAAWLLVLTGGLWLHGGEAAALFALAVAVFALGECLHGSVQGALIADFAKPGLLGRYMALHGVVHQLGWAAGRAVGGLALAIAADAMWVAAAVLALMCGMGALALERALPDTLRRTPRRKRLAPATHRDSHRSR